MRTIFLTPMFLLAACAATPQAPAPVTFNCTDGSTLRVVFVQDTARITLPGGEDLLLPQQVSGSGFRYGTPRHELRGKGDEIEWTVGRRVPLTCRAQR